MKELTDWETGQELIAISDFIADKCGELDLKRFPQLIKELDRMRALLGNELDTLKSHEFGIYNGACFRKEYFERLPGYVQRHS